MSMRNSPDLISEGNCKTERARTGHKLAVGVGILAVVGVVTALLFATKSGKEARKDLKKKVLNTVETIEDTVQKRWTRRKIM